MTDSEILAMWQGWKNHTTLGWCRPIGNSGSWFAEVDVPDYLNNDAAAMSLLTTLTAKNLYPSIDFNTDKRWTVIIDDYYGVPLVIKQGESTYVGKEDTPLTQVIVSAVLELIEKGKYND